MKIKLLFALLCIQIAFSQQRTCGMEQQMQRIMANPILKAQYLQQQSQFEIEYQRLLNLEYSRNSQAENTLAPQIIIPVAVHFPSITASTSEAEKNCLRSLAQTQINVINADYNAANADLSIWTGGVNAIYPNVTVGNLNVQFQIAISNHPAGTGLSDGQVAVTFGTDFLNGADTDNTWAGYLNFVVRDLGGNTLGYSSLGGLPSGGYTVVMNTFCFGTDAGCANTGYTPQAPYNLGRTVTHELGHYFNLNHTFDGCSTTANCANTGDRVCDTPSSNAATYGCPNPGSVLKCSNTKVLTMNYMDYTNDPCMYLFTAGQVTRMQAYLNTIKTQFTTTALGKTAFLENSFSIAPNPNQGSFTINFKDTVSDYSVEIFDVLGNTIYKNKYDSNAVSEQTVQIPNASTGIYFLNLKTNSEETVTKKLIVQ